MILFFTSRRRHTRWPRDWSSDVCSSDLDVDESAGAGLIEGVALVVGGQIEVVQAGLGAAPGDGRAAAVQRHADIAVDVALGVLDEGNGDIRKIGRAHV